jgi:hypothetical protein
MAIWAHPDCDFYHNFDISPSRFPLLQSCHQTYSEAINLLYTNNIFDFAHPETFLWLTRTIRTEKLALIASLCFAWFRKPFRWVLYASGSTCVQPSQLKCQVSSILPSIFSLSIFTRHCRKTVCCVRSWTFVVSKASMFRSESRPRAYGLVMEVQRLLLHFSSQLLWEMFCCLESKMMGRVSFFVTL